MRRLGRIRTVRLPKAERQAPPGSRRDRLAALLGLVTVVCLGSALFLSKGTRFLMPGPLASAHGAIDNCGACHTKSGSGKLSWIHGLIAGDPLADSKACLTCHKMPDTAFNAHSAPAEVLKQSTKRLTKIAAATPAPLSARAQSIAFPTHDVVAAGLYCTTCHKEHQGVTFKLAKISNEQCRSCHVVKFDSFDGHHPKFDNYPFKRRTRIIYDHAGHFGKHFPEVAQKDPAKRIPATCSTCHNSRDDKRIMAVAPFEQTCTACHLDQITGKERASGPKGVAFLTLPGLDLQTLKKKNAAIGEWPEASDAELTPFMKVMISRTERGRALIKTAEKLNLQDLAAASDDQIKAVTGLVWEIKGLFYELISGKASDVLGNLNIGGGAKLSANLVADLTASIPRDVVISAHEQWLPNLATEMANRQDARAEEQSGWGTAVTESRLAGSVSPEELAGSDARQAAPRLSPQAAGGKAASVAKPIRLAQANQQTQTKNAPGAVAEERWRVDAFGRVIKGPEDEAKAAEPEGAAGKADTSNAKPDGGKETLPAGEQPGASQAPVNDAGKAAQPKGTAGKTDTANAKPDNGSPTAQTDDLLHPTPEELRAGGGSLNDYQNAARPEGAAGKTATANATPGGGSAEAAGSENSSSDGAAAGAAPGADTAAAEPQARAAPVISIKSDVDPESWAEYGGWYEQDYAIFYRPTGHKDKFIYSWLFLTGPQAPKGDTSPAAAVFDALTAKDAQGSCTKCHSVDDVPGKGRHVNFGPATVKTKEGRFTNFIHAPHFGILENRGCLTCHKLEKGRPYLKSYEQGNPQNFVSNFGVVKKELCQTCHTTNAARQDCLTCHKYHLNGVITPIMNTKIPAQ